MMSVAPVASAGEAAGYYSNSDNYYFLGSLQSLWMGEGAKALGLEGNVRGDDLTAVLEGRLPDGSRLGKEVNGQHVHRPGHDLTFSAPKSVSILALIGNDKEMVEAHNHAVRVAAGYVEKLISARDTKDGVTSIVHTGKMVAAAYTHDTSRNLDPQLHTHLLIANMTEYAGKWKALATDYIHNAGFIETVMKHQVTLGKIYRSALRERVEALGHEVEEVGKHGMWEIKGVPEDVRDEYSSRGREIQGAVGAEATLRSRDVAAKDTRRAKVDPSRMRLMERWLGQMKEKGFDLKAYQESVVPRDAGLRETAPQPERDHQAKPVPAGPELASLQTSSTAEKSVDTPAQPAERESQSRQAVTQPADTLRQTVQTGPEKTPATRSVPAAQLDTEIPRPELTEAVRLAISQLSDSKTRFTFGELMMTTAELSEQLPEIQEIRVAIDAALKDGMIVPLDSEKGVFTSRIHLLDELSIQALSQEHLKSTKVVSFTRPAQYAPAALEVVEKDALVLMNAPSGVAGTRRFPEPALALPVYDNNGRSAGLALVSLIASPEGRMTQGETRMVMTERARGAVLQRSQSGNTIVVSDLAAALDAVRHHPKDGVVWQTGDEPPSAWLLKVSGGTQQDVSPGTVSTLTDGQSVQQLREQMLAEQIRNEEAGRSRQPEPLPADVPQEEVIRLKPEDINPRKPEPLTPDADVIARVRSEENTGGQEMKAAAGVRSELEGADKASGELSRASRVIADLANAERDMLRAAENTERGRMPEREEQTLTRTIQKER